MLSRLIVIIVAFNAQYCFCSVTKELTSLTKWTELCFEKIPEYQGCKDSSSDYYKNYLDIDSNDVQSLFNSCKPLLSKQLQAIIDCENANIKLENAKRLTESNTTGKTYRELDDLKLDTIVAKDTGTYVYKQTIQQKNWLLFGDLHGSIHSLLRNLMRLYQQKIIDQKWRLRSDYCLFFLGDFVDRGASGLECWMTLMQLKIMNPEQVFLCRGNHEDCEVYGRYGFLRECNNKISSTGKDDSSVVIDIFQQFCVLLPVAIFARNSESAEYVQCCHGGIEPRFNTEALLASSDIGSFLPNKKHYAGFNWSDFTGIEIEEDYKTVFKDSVDVLKNASPIIQLDRFRTIDKWATSERVSKHTWRDFSGGFKADIPTTHAYLEQTTLKAFFRGHQDKDYPCKVICNGCKEPVAWHTLWGGTGVKSVHDFISNRDTIPVITCTTAAQPYELAQEGYLQVTAEGPVANWQLSPCVFVAGVNQIQGVARYIDMDITDSKCSFATAGGYSGSLNDELNYEHPENLIYKSTVGQDDGHLKTISEKLSNLRDNVDALIKILNDIQQQLNVLHGAVNAVPMHA